MQLIAQRGDKVDLALVPIGGHYTMDRYDAVTAVELINPQQVIPCHYDTFPPIETDAEAFKQDVQNAGFSEVVVARARARRHTRQVTHAIVLIEAERTAIETLGGAARRRRRASPRRTRSPASGTSSRCCACATRRRSPRSSRTASPRSTGIKRTHTMVAFEVFSQHDLEALFSIGT